MTEPLTAEQLTCPHPDDEMQSASVTDVGQYLPPVCMRCGMVFYNDDVEIIVTQETDHD